MSYCRICSIFFLFVFLVFFISSLSADPFYSGEIALYSSRTGKLITNLSYSVEVNSSDTPEDYLLTIGNKAGIKGDKGEKLSLWVFGRKIDAQQFAKRNSSTEVDDIYLFDSFCQSSKVRFTIPSARRIENIAVIPFDVNDADPGAKIDLVCTVYIAAHKKKKIIINDEAQLKIDFVLPSQTVRDKEGKLIVLDVDKNVNSTTPLTPEEIEEQKQFKEDSIQKAKIKQLHVFISEVNNEMTGLNTRIDNLLESKTYEMSQVDSLENLANVLKKKVDFQEQGNIALFPSDESLVNSFTDFSSKYSETIKKIGELKIPPAKRNWLMILAIAAVAMFAIMFILQIWNLLKSKRQQLKMKKEMFKVNKKSELDNLDDDDLGKI